MTTNVLTLPLPNLAAQFLLRPDVVFLNHGSFGACPQPVFETYQGWQRQLEAKPVEFLGRQIGKLLAEARERLAAYIGAEGSQIAFVPNATHGINIVARSLDLQAGDEVLGTDHEYGAIERTWRFNSEPRGVRYVRQPLSLPVQSAEAIVEQFWAGVTERTRVIVVSHITSPTALIFPVAEICKRARQAGIWTIVDGAHAPSQLDLDMQAIGADFYSGNCHKWLCAPKGAGFLYARPEVQPLLKPLIVSWGWQAERPGPSPFVDYFDWIGTADPAAYLSVPAAIDFQKENNWPAVRAACHELLLDASQQLTELSGREPLSPDGADWWVQMRTLPLPACDVEQLKARLWDDYQIEVPVHNWYGQPYIRISIQAYNSPNDIDRLVEALKRILGYTAQR
jgi:isopenicillin-N epimerase